MNFAKTVTPLICLAILAYPQCNAFSLLRQLRFRQMYDLMMKQDPGKDLWIEQRLDNFHSTDERTWNQRYFMEDAYSSPGGPVFLQIGGEGPANPEWMNNGHWILMAKQVKALCFMIEHRFYGKSHPTSDVSTANLSYLSSEQALADIANFITNMTVVYKLQGRKWIVFGGSYSGALAIWARLKYPHLISGAVSASAPLNAKVDFTGYLQVAGNSLRTMGSEACVENLRRASEAVGHYLKTDDGRDRLFIRFRLCKTPRADGADDAFLQESLAGNVMNVVQYNRDNTAFEGRKLPFTIKDVCGIMENASIGTPMDRYAVFNSLNLDHAQSPCLDPDYDQYLTELSNASWTVAVGGRQWIYQTCSEFGWYQTTDSSSQPFMGFDVDYALNQCQKAFGISPNQVREAAKRTNEMYGATQVANHVSNVSLYNGGIDPWSNVSFVSKVHFKESKLRFRRDVSLMEKPSTSTGHGIESVFVPDTAHCAIMYPASPDDSPYLTKARIIVEQKLRAWLGI